MIRSLPPSYAPSEDDVIKIDALVASLRAATLPQLLHALAIRTALDIEASASTILSRLIEAEAQAPASVGNGVGIFQLRLPKIETPYMLFGRTPRRIDIGAIDGQPADLFFLMLSPAEDIAGHLRRLSRLSRAVRNETLCSQLRAVTNEDGLRAIFLGSGELLVKAA